MHHLNLTQPISLLISATLNWSALTSAVSYDVEYKPAHSSTWINAAYGYNIKIRKSYRLKSCNVYYWRVRAIAVRHHHTYRAVAISQHQLLVEIQQDYQQPISLPTVQHLTGALLRMQLQL